MKLATICSRRLPLGASASIRAFASLRHFSPSPLLQTSLKAGQYYAHPRNAFWHIMGELFGAGPSLPYQERIAILRSIGVALWDSLQACIRLGSLDASIKEEVANDFPALFAKYPNITHVFFNGSKAERSFLRHAKPALSEDRHVFARLPSTSAAHAAMRLEVKVEAWSVVKKGLFLRSPAGRESRRWAEQYEIDRVAGLKRQLR